MDQQNSQQNTPYESISSLMPTYESFSSQQNTTIKDETIDVETLGSEDKKRKRKAPSNPRKPKAKLEDNEDFDILTWWKINSLRFPNVSRMAKDWIRTSSRNITMDTLEDLMKDGELAKEIQEGLDKQKGEQTQGKEKNVEA
ncbi:zinc finger BED domain-containing protein RICESLEEPER 2 [Tanacetum coccineum]